MSGSQAAEASNAVRDVLELLDGPLSPFAVGVAENRYAFWLGSGISFGRVEGLRQLVARVIEFLRTRAEEDETPGPFRSALMEAMDLVQLESTELSEIDFTSHFSTWPTSTTIVSRLATNYSTLLDIAVEGESDDYLLWVATEFVKTFGSEDTEPDVEHVCIACLAIEGVASEIVCANWDALIERADNQLSAGGSNIRVCVIADDLRELQRRASLYKLHGCALLASKDPDKYRPYLVVSRSQIEGWTSAERTRVLAEHLTDLAVTKPTLMLGLSAQDTDIHAVLGNAEARMLWSWPGERPAYLFAEEGLGQAQKSLLKLVYRNVEGDLPWTKVFESASIGAYAKPLLVALLLHVVGQKLCLLLELASGLMSQEERRKLCEGITQLRNRAADTAAVDPFEFLLHALPEWTRLQNVHDGEEDQAIDRLGYKPFAPFTLQQLRTEPFPLAPGRCEFAAALAILGLGELESSWNVETAGLNESPNCSLRLTSAMGSVTVLLVNDAYAEIRFREIASATESTDMVVVHSRRLPQSRQRTPRRAPGRTGGQPQREVSIAALLEESESALELLQRFREEVAL